MLMLTSTHRRIVAKLNADAGAAYKQERERARICGRALAEKVAECDALEKALADIIAMETPGCAHVGKRMAARAQAVMGETAREAA